MTDTPIFQDINNSNDSKKMSQKISEEKNEFEIINNKLSKERARKYFGTVKEDEKNKEIIDIKRLTDIQPQVNNKEENDKDKTRVKGKLKSLLKNGHSHVETNVPKLVLIDECNDNDETDKNNNKENTNADAEQKEFKRNKKKKSGKSVRINPGTIEEIDKIQKESIKPEKPKFIRNKRKSATLVGNAFKLSEKLQGIEKKYQ